MLMDAIRTTYAAQLQLRRRMLGAFHQAKNWLAGAAPTNTAQRIQSPGKILVVVCGLIGDSVMCAPVVRETKRLWPGAKLTLLGRRHNCMLFSSLPEIDECHETATNPLGLRNHGQKTSFRRWLASNKFDIAILLLGEDFAHLLASTEIPIRVGPRQMPLAPCMTHVYDNGTPRTWGPHEKLNSLRALGFEVPDQAPRLAVSNDSRTSAQRKLLALGLQPQTPYAVIHPFGSESARWWPMDRAELLSNALLARVGLSCVLVGGHEIREQIDTHKSRGLFDAVGILTIQELSAVLEACAVVITTDSGPFHVAGALQRPTIGLFRARRPEHAQRYPRARVIFGTDRECERKCSWDRCRSHPCRQMKEISVAQVLDQVEELLADPCGT